MVEKCGWVGGCVTHGCGWVYGWLMRMCECGWVDG